MMNSKTLHAAADDLDEAAEHVRSAARRLAGSDHTNELDHMDGVLTDFADELRAEAKLRSEGE